jgi:hypothetical protein
MTAQRMHSAAVLKFADDATLFIGDTKGSALFAGRMPPQQGRVDRFFNVYDVDRKIAALLGCATDELLVNDLAVHPRTGRAYLAVEYGAQEAPAIVHLGPDEDIEVLDLGALALSRVALADPLPKRPGIPVGSVSPLDLTITDIACHGQTVLVAGLTNNAFRSTLRVVRHPFEGEVQQSFVEMYHTVHNRLETRAPINKLTVVELDGVPTVIAAYTCTPVVAIRLEDLASHRKVSAKTIAEIGYSSIPPRCSRSTSRCPTADRVASCSSPTSSAARRCSRWTTSPRPCAGLGSRPPRCSIPPAFHTGRCPWPE